MLSSYTDDGICLAGNRDKNSKVNEVPQSLDSVLSTMTNQWQTLSSQMTETALNSKIVSDEKVDREKEINKEAIIMVQARAWKRA